jgi:hypothetical protein
MKIAFGVVPVEYRGESGGDFIFKDKQGNLQEYYYLLNVDDEADGNGTFTIQDTAGRYLPMDFNTLDEFVRLITTLKEFKDDQAEFNRYWETRWQQG